MARDYRSPESDTWWLGGTFLAAAILGYVYYYLMVPSKEQVHKGRLTYRRLLAKDLADLTPEDVADMVELKVEYPDFEDKEQIRALEEELYVLYSTFPEVKNLDEEKLKMWNLYLNPMLRMVEGVDSVDLEKAKRLHAEALQKFADLKVQAVAQQQ